MLSDPTISQVYITDNATITKYYEQNVPWSSTQASKLIIPLLQNHNALTANYRFRKKDLL